MKNKKKIFVFGFIGILVLVILFIVFMFHTKYKAAVDTTNFTTYTQSFVQISIPSSWKPQRTDTYSTTFYDKGKKVGTIEVNPYCDYCGTTESLIDNFFGLRGYAKGKIQERKIDSVSQIKVTIAYEKSASQETEEAEPDELHYLFTDHDKLFVDLYLDSNQLSDKTRAKISNSFILTNKI